jgi:DNA-binding response OmpR family regulator
MKKYKCRNLGTIAARTKGRHISEIELMQFSLEQQARRLSKLEAAHNANDKELKDLQIQNNLKDLQIKRLRERLERRDSE